MGYGAKSLNDLRDEAHKTAVEHGFKDATVGEDIALMHSELSEALEDYRAGHAPNEVWYEEPYKLIGPLPNGEGTAEASAKVIHKRMFQTDRPFKPCGIPSELADVIIRILHFSGKHGIDIEQAVREKMIYNESRPFKHGDKKL